MDSLMAEKSKRGKATIASLPNEYIGSLATIGANGLQKRTKNID